MFHVLLYRIIYFASSFYVLIWVKIWYGEKGKTVPVFWVTIQKTILVGKLYIKWSKLVELIETIWLELNFPLK